MLTQQAQEQQLNSISTKDWQIIEDPWELPDLDVKTTLSQSWQLPQQLHHLLVQAGNPNALCLPSPHYKPARLLIQNWLKLGTDKAKTLTVNLREILGLLYWLEIATC
jgi:hypothetical protein